jgi:hypothetical protein
MTYEEKRQHFQGCKQKGDVMAVVQYCDGIASYATIIKALNNPSKYKSKKEQQIIDVAYQYVNSRARGVVYNHHVLEG